MSFTAPYPVTQTPKLEVGFVFNAFKGSYGYECEIVEEREKAIKVKAKAYIVYPGVVDKSGRYIGYKWIPKSALRCEITEGTDMWYFAKWYNIETA